MNDSAREILTRDAYNNCAESGRKCPRYYWSDPYFWPKHHDPIASFNLTASSAVAPRRCKYSTKKQDVEKTGQNRTAAIGSRDQGLIEPG